MKVLILISLMVLIGCEPKSEESENKSLTPTIDGEKARLVSGTYYTDCLEGSNRYYAHEFIMMEDSVQINIEFYSDAECTDVKAFEHGAASFSIIGDELAYDFTELTYANPPENTPQCPGVDHSDNWGVPHNIDDIDCEYSLENEDHILIINEAGNYELNGIEYL